MVLPSDTIELCEAVLCELHASALGGHLAHKKVEALVWCRFYWLKLSASVYKFCLDSDAC